MLLELGGIQYYVLIYLYIVNYHIQLTEDEINLCTIILSWVKCRYNFLTMVVSNSPKRFQKQNEQFIPRVLFYICVHI